MANELSESRLPSAEARPATPESKLAALTRELLEEDDYPKEYMERISEETKNKVRKKAKQVRTGLYSIAPMKCKGFQKCPFKEHCPLAEIKNGKTYEGDPLNYPVGYACVLENTFLKAKIIDYMNYLKVDPENPIEMSIVNDLGLIDLYKNRATLILSSGDGDGQGIDFLRIDIGKVHDNGHGDEKAIVEQTVQVHPALAIIDQLEKRRQKLLDQLGETRDAQYKRQLKQGNAKQQNKVIEEINRLKVLIESKQVSGEQLAPLQLKD